MTVSARRNDLVALLAVTVLAPAIALRDMLLHGFALVGGNTEDAQLNAYLLEHSWRWLVRDPLHRALWDLPIFFPAGGNALAFSDVMAAYGPLYWPWRALGARPDTSYQLWLLASLGASAAAGYLFLHRFVGASPLPAAARLQPAPATVPAEERERFQARLQRWLQRKGIAPADAARVQWIALPPG